MYMHFVGYISALISKFQLELQCVYWNRGHPDNEN